METKAKSPGHPLSRTPATEGRPVDAGKMGVSLQKRVLIVDDDHDAVEVLEQILMLEGHQVASATTSEDALAIAEEFEPHVVVLDIGLPNIDGYELASHLRFKVDQECIFLAATGFGARSFQEKSFKAGFKAHMTKPIDVSELLSHLTDQVTP